MVIKFLEDRPQMAEACIIYMNARDDEELKQTGVLDMTDVVLEANNIIVKER